MSSRDDLRPADSREDGAAARFVLATLRQSPEPVAISVVGGATDIAVASKLEPALFAAKCAGVYLNAGSAMPNPAKPGVLEFNVALNPAGYAALFDLPCPLYWCPCWHMTEQHQVGQHGTFWRFAHRAVLSDLRADLQKTLLYMFDQEPSHRWLNYLRRPLDERHWAFFLDHWRNMWSTASLLHAAGQSVTPGGEIVPLAAGLSGVFRFVPIAVSCADDGQTQWSTRPSATAPPRYLFEITDQERYQSAMSKALTTLLQEL